MRWRTLPCCLLLGWAPAPAEVTVRVVPALQFVREGRSVQLKARTRGDGSDPGWTWQVMTPGGGSLRAGPMGNVLYCAEGVAPWSRVRVRATSIRHREAFGEAVVEVLPDGVFRVLEGVLGPHWLEEAAEAPPSIRIQVVPPSLFSWSNAWTLIAELDGPEPDRFAWSLEPGPDPTPVEPRRHGREAVLCGHSPPGRVRVRVTSLANPARTAEIEFERPTYARLIPVDIHGFPGEDPWLLP